MAKIICTQAEYNKLSTVLEDNPQFLADVRIIYDIVKEVPAVLTDYTYGIEAPHSVVVDSSGLPVKFVIELDAKKLRFPTETSPTLDAAEGCAIEQCVFES